MSGKKAKLKNSIYRYEY